MVEQKSPLSDLIAAEIRINGPIPFSRYMELCLYAPGLGYYQTSSAPVGRGGDFFTAPHVSRLFGAAIARWMAACAQQDGLSAPTLLELGPGDGTLAGDILASWHGPPPRLVLVEAGAVRRRALSDRFSREGALVLGPEALDSLPPSQGFVLANEFFDALPVRIVERQGDRLLDVHVGIGSQGFAEQLVPLDEASTDPAFLGLLADLPDGARAECPKDGRLWTLRLAGALERGSALVFDYGDEFDLLVAPWRERGTLRCFRSHQVDTDPLDAPGEKDITASVNFTLLRAWAREAGLEVERYTTQSSFLIRAGILELAEEAVGRAGAEEDGTRLWRSLQTLIHDEAGMGEAFKVMVLRKTKTKNETETEQSKPIPGRGPRRDQSC